MRKTAAIPAFVLLIVAAGCGSPEAGSEQEDISSPASAASTPSAFAKPAARATLKESCLELFGTDQDGPFFETVFFVSETTNGNFDSETGEEKAHRLDRELKAAAEDAPEELEQMLSDFHAPLADIVGLLEGTQEEETYDLDVYKLAARDVIDTCAPFDPSGSAAASPTPAPAPAPAPAKADEVSAAYPGYPLLVNVASLDYRVARTLEGKLVDGQVVALAPGLYAPYNPNVPDLKSYYESGGVSGDSAMKNSILPRASGSTWSGVLPGAEEPQ